MPSFVETFDGTGKSTLLVLSLPYDRTMLLSQNLRGEVSVEV